MFYFISSLQFVALEKNMWEKEPLNQNAVDKNVVSEVCSFIL